MNKAAARRGGGKGWARGWSAALLGVVVLVGAPGGAWAQGVKPDAAALAEAERLNDEVVKLYGQADFSAAIPLAERALALRERALGPLHPDVATSLNNLAALYKTKGEYDKA